MDKQDQLFGLMAIAEEHQAAVRAAVDALASERQLLGQQSAAHSKQLRELTAAATDAVERMHSIGGQIVRTVAAHTVEHTSRAVAGGFDAATKPVIAQLAGIAGEIDGAQVRLRATMTWFSWRSIAVLAASAGGILLVIWIVAMAMIEWQRYQIDSLREEREALIVEVAKLNAAALDFERRGGRAELADCGSPRRLCIRVNKTVGYGEGRDFFVVKGY